MQKKLILILGILFAVSSGLFSPQVFAQSQIVSSDEIIMGKFDAMWNYSDGAFLSGRAASNPPGRSWTWGWRVSSTIFYEDYAEAPNGKRRVIYQDKSRMEVGANGDNVTNGLLTKELVTGRQQDGHAKFTQRTPSTTQIVGDPNLYGGNSKAPTYTSFQNVITFNPGENTASAQIGQVINRSINKAGTVSILEIPPFETKIGYYEPVTGHNVAEVFQNFQQLEGEVYNGSAWVKGKVYTDNPTTNVFGYAISEPFWTRAQVAYVEKDVLVQLFERRVLTYTPSNAAPFQVEMGNIGRHYFEWRYPDIAKTVAKFGGVWYTNLGVLNIFNDNSNSISIVNLANYQGDYLIRDSVKVSSINNNLLVMNGTVASAANKGFNIVMDVSPNAQTFRGSISLLNNPNQPPEKFCGSRQADFSTNCS